MFQYGTHDEYAPLRDAKHFLATSAGPKQIKIYNSGHALNADARRDRVQFLEEHLKLAHATPGALDKIPDTK